MIYLGVDPGSHGAVALVGNGWVEVRPVADWTRSDYYDFLYDHWAEFAFIEKVNAMPPAGRKAGTSSMFKFGMAYERALMALTLVGIPFDEVVPAKWQQAVGLRFPKNTPYPERKRLAKQRAQELFPDIKVTLETADALLIAEAARRLKCQI